MDREDPERLVRRNLRIGRGSYYQIATRAHVLKDGAKCGQSSPEKVIALALGYTISIYI